MWKGIIPEILAVCMLFSHAGTATGEDTIRPGIEQVKQLFSNADLLPEDASQRDSSFFVWDGPVEVTYEPGRWIPAYKETLLITVAAQSTSHVTGLVHNLIAIYDPVSQTLLTPLYHFSGDSLEQKIYHGKERDFLLYAGGSGGQGYHYDLSVLFEFRKGHIAAGTPHVYIQDIEPDRRRVEITDDRLKIWECSDETVEAGCPCKYRCRETLRWDRQTQKFVRDTAKNDMKMKDHP